LKKQASFFFKEKLKTARLALTDVTPLQLMTEEATDGESCGLPDFLSTTEFLKLLSAYRHDGSRGDYDMYRQLRVDAKRRLLSV
jgi:hypothetical protein